MNNWYYYILKLKDGCYYVGITTEPSKRIHEHVYKDKKGAKWTKKHEVVDVLRIEYIGLTNSHYAKMIERQQTIAMMKKYGWKLVRGSDYCTVSEYIVREQLLVDIFERRVDAKIGELGDELVSGLYSRRKRAYFEYKGGSHICEMKDIKRFCKMNKVKKITKMEIYDDLTLREVFDCCGTGV